MKNSILLLSKKNSFCGNYSRKYGISIPDHLANIQKLLQVFYKLSKYIWFWNFFFDPTIKNWIWLCQPFSDILPSSRHIKKIHNGNMYFYWNVSCKMLLAFFQFQSTVRYSTRLASLHLVLLCSNLSCLSNPPYILPKGHP